MRGPAPEPSKGAEGANITQTTDVGHRAEREARKPGADDDDAHVTSHHKDTKDTENLFVLSVSLW